MKLALLLVFLLAPAMTSAQDSVTTWTAASEAGIRVVPDVTYLTAGNWEAKLDLYLVQPDDAAGSRQLRPTIIFIHGGGWVNGSKEGSVMSLMPYLAMGLNVVNV